VQFVYGAGVLHSLHFRPSCVTGMGEIKVEKLTVQFWQLKIDSIFHVETYLGYKMHSILFLG